MDIRILRTAQLLSAVALSLALAGAAMASPSNKWRIQVNHSADVAGSVVLRFAPVGGTASDIEVAIPKGTGENAAARRIRDAIRAAVGKQYKAETDDGEDVLVKRRSGAPKVEITMASNTARGLKISLEHE